MYVCTLFVYLVPLSDQKQELDPLEVELLMVVSYHVRAEDQTQVFQERSKCS